MYLHEQKNTTGKEKMQAVCQQPWSWSH